MLALPARAQDPRASEAQTVALAWLALTDANDAKASWDAAAAEFRGAIRSSDGRRPGEVAGSVGHAAARAARRRLARVIPGLPDGDYALLRFRTMFAGKPDAEER